MSFSPRSSSDIAKNLNRIQGNILEGFNKDYQSFLFLTFTDAGRGRAWLGTVVSEVASVDEVRDFNDLFKKLKGRRGGELGILKATWMNLAFTFGGLQALGVSMKDLALFPDAFRQGMKARAAAIGDVGRSDPKNWIAPLQAGDIHAVMLVASDSQEDLGEHVLRYIHNIGLSGGVQLAYLQEGSVRHDEPGHEHFGFKDGVSQPAVRHYDPHNPAGEPIQAAPGQDRLHAGEFILGYPTQIGTPKACGVDGSGKKVFLNPNPDEGPVSPGHAGESVPDWAVDGSYLVFRRLAQDVRGFRDFVAKKSVELFPGLNADPRTAIDVMGAKIVGRYATGCPLEKTKDQERLIAQHTLPADFDPAAGDPSLLFPNILGDDKTSTPSKYLGNLAEDDSFDNNFEYGDDTEGLIVPRGAHIRKAYPRDSATPGGGESSTQQHRILRRGIPFGTSFRPTLGATGHGGKPGLEEPGDRGLLFLCYQSSLARQFEFIQNIWVNNVDFPGKPKRPDGPDPNTGQWFSDLGSSTPGDPDGQDPLIAQNTDDGPFKIPVASTGDPEHEDPSRSFRFEMHHFVTTTGGDYFFQPSIEALYTVLAGLPSPFGATGTGTGRGGGSGDVDDPGFDPCADAIADAIAAAKAGGAGT
jgi:Dyp-type peroxidase family